MHYYPVPLCAAIDYLMVGLNSFKQTPYSRCVSRYVCPLSSFLISCRQFWRNLENLKGFEVVWLEEQICSLSDRSGQQHRTVQSDANTRAFQVPPHVISLFRWTDANVTKSVIHITNIIQSPTSVSAALISKTRYDVKIIRICRRM